MYNLNCPNFVKSIDTRQMKKIILLTMLCFGLYQSQAQEIYNSSGKTGKARYKENQTKKGFDPNRLVFGGGVGLMFGDITNISIQPFIGYRITDKFAAGISMGYNYYSEKNGLVSNPVNSGPGNPVEPKLENFTQSIYTAGLWGQYNIFSNILVRAQFEINNIDYYESTPTIVGNYYENEKQRLNIPCLLLGAGYRFPLTEHSSFYMLAMYDVLQNISSNTRTDYYGKYSLSPYANTLDVRVGFSIGF